jgi:hypothetical protein
MKGFFYRLYAFIEDHVDSCRFFDEFGILIQGCLGIICLLALMVKRYLEVPRRPLLIWFLDTMKQVVGQMTQHFANLYIANRIGHKDGMECEWYLINLIVDCTLGVFFCYLYLKIATHVVSGTGLEFKSGDYGQGSNLTLNEDSENIKWSFNSFLNQLVWWVCIVAISKFTALGIILIFYQLLEHLGIMLLTPFKNDPKLKLIFVMIIFPVIFNIIQFWFTDNVIKSKPVNQNNKDNRDNEDNNEDKVNLLVSNDNQ